MTLSEYASEGKSYYLVDWGILAKVSETGLVFHGKRRRI